MWSIENECKFAYETMLANVNDEYGPARYSELADNDGDEDEEGEQEEQEGEDPRWDAASINHPSKLIVSG